MWLASHVVTGGLIYDSIKNEPRWVKWPLFVVAAYIFHWLMDSTPVFHDMDWPWNWWQWGIAAWNGAVVSLFLWQRDPLRSWPQQSKWFLKRLLTRIVVGGFAWLSLDAFWINPTWGKWVHGLFPNIGRWSEPKSAGLELAFMLLVAVLAWNRVVKKKRVKAGTP